MVSKVSGTREEERKYKMIIELLSLWVFFVGGLLAVLCYVAGFVHGSRLFKTTRDLNAVLKRMRANMDRIQQNLKTY